MAPFQPVAEAIASVGSLKILWPHTKDLVITSIYVACYKTRNYDENEPPVRVTKSTEDAGDGDDDDSRHRTIIW